MKKLVLINDYLSARSCRDMRPVRGPMFARLECKEDGEVIDSLENYKLIDEAFDYYYDKEHNRRI